MNMKNDEYARYDGLALFSGGLDSILAARLLMEQGKKILCLHFTSPFFGDEKAVPVWEKKYGLEIIAVDIAEEYCRMLCHNPANGFGSALNPCVDCKILMMKKAKTLMAQFGAKFLISGEVIGQRPMSQRRDTLHVIRRDAEVKDILLRPLCAKCMEPTPFELSGEVEREKLLGIYGRGRKEQLALAKTFNITDIPTTLAPSIFMRSTLGRWRANSQKKKMPAAIMKSCKKCSIQVPMTFSLPTMADSFGAVSPATKISG